MNEAPDVPATVRAVVERLNGFTGTWSLCGGWTVDAWLGRATREHADVDVAMFIDEQRRIWQQLGDWQFVAHDSPDDSHDIPWDGHKIGFPAHLHADVHYPKREIQLNERDGATWILQREPRVTLSVARFALPSPWRLPTMAPEAVLFYKGAERSRRPHDQQDFDALLPVLEKEQRNWLADALASIDPAHPWLDRLA